MVTKEQRLSSIVETKVETSVDKDTNARDGESSVETRDTIRSEGLSVNIDQTVVLSFAVFA